MSCMSAEVHGMCQTSSSDGSARGLVTIDMQATVPRGSIQDLTSPGACHNHVS